MNKYYILYIEKEEYMRRGTYIYKYMYISIYIHICIHIYICIVYIFFDIFEGIASKIRLKIC